MPLGAAFVRIRSTEQLCNFLELAGRIGISWSRSNANVVYAFVDNHTSKREPKPGELDPYGRPIQVIPVGVQVYRSNDKGEHWVKVSTEDDKMSA